MRHYSPHCVVKILCLAFGDTTAKTIFKNYFSGNPELVAYGGTKTKSEVSPEFVTQGKVPMMGGCHFCDLMQFLDLKTSPMAFQVTLQLYISLKKNYDNVPLVLSVMHTSYTLSFDSCNLFYPSLQLKTLKIIWILSKPT